MRVSRILISTLFALGFQFCKKHQMPDLYEFTIQKTLMQGESFSYVLPANDGGFPYRANDYYYHIKRCEIKKDATGKDVLYYTPDPNFTGKDKVLVTNVYNGPCSATGIHKKHYNMSANYVFHFDITIENPPVSKTTYTLVSKN